MSDINFAIVGCGHIANKHIEAIRNVNGAHLAALCDTNIKQLEQFSIDNNVPGYTSIEEMLSEDKSIDLVCICTPSGIHASLAIKAAEAKKHVIIEKPIALTLKDADAIINACEKNGVKLSIVHPNRFRPAIVELKKAMDDGLFGKISHANATVRWNRNQDYYDQAAWRGSKAMDGGVLMNQAIHNLDLLVWLLGGVNDVKAFTATRLRDIECDDVAVASIRFNSGALGVIEAATTIYPKNYEESLSIFGEKGSAVIAGQNANRIRHWVFESLSDDISQQIIKSIDEDPNGISGHQHIITDMMYAIKHNRKPIITGEDGRNALKLVLAIYEAAEKNKTICWDER
jgi:UDP-N-acetyl-2-amino-2-deoxyglucuronate dehydrogenase